MKDFSVFTPYSDFGMVYGRLMIKHVPTGREYEFFSVVIREHDLMPCALYGRPGSPMWVRPLREILFGGKWAWGPSWAIFMDGLKKTLTEYEWQGHTMPSKDTVERYIEQVADDERDR